MNRIILIGRLTDDPELKTTNSGTSVSTFTLAVNRDYTPKGGEKTADFIPCVAWRQTAEFVDKYLTKGLQIAVEGSLQTRKYEDKNGNKRTAYEVNVDRVHFCGGRDSGDTDKSGMTKAAPDEDEELPF